MESMKNHTNIHPFQAITGLLLLLFSISYMPVRIESLLVQRIDLIQEKEAEEAMAEVLSMEHGLSREQMNELNAEVTQTNSEINRIINHSAAVNDSLNALMERAVNTPHLLDTIQELYNSGIMADEKKIDSLNQIFTEKSSRLMAKIQSFNLKDRDLKIAQSAIRNKQAKIRYVSILLPVYIGILTVTLLGGVSFLIIGLKRWSSQNKQGQDSGME